MIGNQLPVLPRQMIDGVVDRAERARPALLIEVTAEALRTACGTRANVFRQFALFALELGDHHCPPAKRLNCNAPRVASWTCGGRRLEHPMIHSLKSSRTIFWAPEPGSNTSVRVRPKAGAGPS